MDKLNNVSVKITSMFDAILRNRLCDLALASPLILWLGLGVVGSILRISHMTPEFDSLLPISSQIATIVLLGLVIAFLIIRRPAVRKAPGLLPRLVALLGCVLPSLVALAPRIDAAPMMMLLTSAIALLGTTAAIYAVLFLGRSFSVFPQARELVTDGPYRLVRHPLYLAELAVMLGAIWELKQPWPLIIFSCAVGVQVMRMHFEEKILSETFPSYHDYMKRTARLFPGIY